MPTPLSKLKGVTPELAGRFKELGLTTTSQLLAIAGTPEDRALLASQVSADATLILALITRADLHRIAGLGDVYIELLETAGIFSAQQLARSDPDSLYAEIMKVNITNQVTRRPPTLTKVRRWIAEAGQLPELVRH